MSALAEKGQTVSLANNEAETYEFSIYGLNVQTGVARVLPPLAPSLAGEYRERKFNFSPETSAYPGELTVRAGESKTFPPAIGYRVQGSEGGCRFLLARGTEQDPEPDTWIDSSLRPPMAKGP